jgi:hypothetical protein
MADIRQGTDEMLGRYPTQLLSNPSSIALIRAISRESENGTPAKDRFRNQESRI